MKNHKLGYILLLIVVVLSGFCSLIYQVIWERILKNSFGGDAISSTIITTTFLLGLGIGAYAFGRKESISLKTYCKVELGIGIFGILSNFLLTTLSTLLFQYTKLFILDLESMKAFLIVLCIVCLLPPCILIGGTLPLIFKAFQQHQGKMSTAGSIYGLNTFGASLGILAAPFFFLNLMPVNYTLYVVGIINILLSVVIYSLSRINTNNTSELVAKHQPEEMPNAKVLLLSFITGFVGLAVENILFRVAAVYWPSSAYNFPLILVSYLLATSIGCAIFAKNYTSSNLSSYARISVLLVLSAVGIIGSIHIRSIFTANPSIWVIGAQFMILTFPFALFFGGIFPLLLSESSPTGHHLPRNSGILYLTNSVGAFCGGIISQFIGYSTLGMKRMLLCLFYGLLLTSIILWLKQVNKKRLALMLVAPVFLLPVTIQNNSWNLYIYGQNGGFEGIEGTTGVATIVWNDKKTAGEVFVNNQQMSNLPDHPKHVKLVIFPLSLRQRDQVLVLGLGGGGMIRELAKDEKISKIDVVDWSHELPSLLNRYDAKKLIENVLNHPKVRLYKTDARLAVNFCAQKKYDVIIDNLSYRTWSGATRIKSEQYFREVSRILKDGGTFVYDINDSDKATIAGISSNFKFKYIHNDSIVLASNNLIDFDLDALEKAVSARRNGPAIYVTMSSDHFLLDYMKNLSGYEQIRPVRDEEPYNEYFLKPF